MCGHRVLKKERSHLGARREQRGRGTAVTASARRCRGHNRQRFLVLSTVQGPSLHRHVDARDPTALAVGARRAAIALQLPSCGGARDSSQIDGHDPHQPQIVRAPLQNWHAMGVRRGTLGLLPEGCWPSRSPSSEYIVACGATGVSVGGARLQRLRDAPGTSS